MKKPVELPHKQTAEKVAGYDPWRIYDVAKELDERMTNEELQEMIEEADCDDDGEVSEEESVDEEEYLHYLAELSDQEAAAIRC